MKSPLRVTVDDHLPLYCTAVKGVPTPNVQWHSEGFPVIPFVDIYQQIYLVPTDIPHMTTYTCIATEYGFDGTLIDTVSSNVTVIVEGKLINTH